MLVSESNHLSDFLKEDTSLGLRLDGSSVRESRISCSPPPNLMHYYVDEQTKNIINNNLKWAAGEAVRPIFQFAYLMLPTPCNQRCLGCFTGQDKNRLPPHLSGPFYSDDEIENILTFLKDHGTRAVVYGGGGELFAWKGAFRFLEQICNYGLTPIIFTNGTLLSNKDISRLNSLGVVLIISLRDVVEKKHNRNVQINGFRKTLSTIDYCLNEGMQDSNRLAVEIPVTKDNTNRVLFDFLPIMRNLNIIPMLEEFIQIMTSPEEKEQSHTFNEARTFFENACEIDNGLGFNWRLDSGQRMIAQPQCQRPLYSFAIYPSGDIMDCPSHSIHFGNFRSMGIEDIIYSETFRKALLDFSICACSVFYTSQNSEIPINLPEYLERLQ